MINSGIALTALPPLSLYIHFPWCERKCPYCDFNSHQVKDGGFNEGRYIEALVADLQTELPNVWGRRVHTIFIGGGTPSLLSPKGLDDLLSHVRALIPIEPHAEITLEANPGSVESSKFAEFASIGINRVSLGIQSFNSDHLKALGRIHNEYDARRAIEIAHNHFERINIDLMYALPKQTLREAQADLQEAISFDVSHLSLYHLTLEPNTYFASHPPVLPHEDESDAMFESALETLAANGYARYEVSAYSKTKQQCKHNLNYWEFGDYIGIGAGAHGKISYPDRVTRQIRERHPETYMSKMIEQGHAVIENRLLTQDDLPFEFMLGALRLIDGVPTAMFSERTGLGLNAISKSITDALRKGLLDEDPMRLKASPLGMRYLNDLQELFLK
ncbi:radical SAM family heme chaperone HemW [Polynucleobacter sp. HIN5]|uniref:radical SAM family heme chaperone HemW n=1 Tax=Polynucleobacter sp. HIN5 TaxID=3047864 RepID=UPI002573E916|nr:radical SAM family heme chaperone HemW [Polynucleobacter sp. HIN5]BEI33923.1 radical SAM family heme chaperone HemW [Polynucleobacter sp. HIN5]